MEKKLKIAIYGVNPYSRNRGIGALAISSLYILNQIAAKNSYNFEYYLFNSTEGKNIIDLGQSKVTVKNINPISLFTVKSIIKSLLDPRKWKTLKTYVSFDYILNMGEGDSFSDIYGKKRFIRINDQNKMAALFKKKLMLLPQTIGPFSNNKIKQQADKSIEKANMVFARDAKSFNYVRNNTLQKNIFEAIDIAFFMPYNRQKFSDKWIHVGLNISALLWNGGYTKDNQFNLKVDYQELIRAIINYFLSITEVKLHIVPHVIDIQDSIENDYAVSNKLVDEYNNDHLILSPFFLSPIHAKNYIAGLDFFAGARMHSTIAAFSAGVPVFPMAYSRKFNGLFEDTLNYEHLGDLVNQDLNIILTKIKDAFNDRKNLQLIIKDKMDKTVIDKKEDMLYYITKFLELN